MLVERMDEVVVDVMICDCGAGISTAEPLAWYKSP